MDDIAAPDDIAGPGSSPTTGTTVAPGLARSQQADNPPRRPRGARPAGARARRSLTDREAERAATPLWFGGWAAGLVCCVEVREAVSVHIRLDGPDGDGTLDRIVSAYQPFTLTTTTGPRAGQSPGGATVTTEVFPLDPRIADDVDRGQLAPLLRLTRCRAREPEWSEEGHAVIRFEDGSVLDYPAHPTETSWMITGRYGETWSSRPGGRVVANEDRASSTL